MRTIWYMGAKTRLTEEILAAVARAAPPGGTVLDLMSGTAAVSHALAGRYRVVANDVQAYAATIARGYLEVPARREAFLASLDLEADLGVAYRENQEALLEHLGAAVALEDAYAEACGFAPEQPDPEVGPVLARPTPARALGRARREVPSDARARARAYRAFALGGTPLFLEEADAGTVGVFRRARPLFTRAAVVARRRDPGTFPYLLASTYYPNVYLGLRQAVAVDSLRYAIDRLPTGGPFAAAKRVHYLAALLHAVSVATSATSHFCQPRGLVRDAEVRAVLARRAISIPSRATTYSRAIAQALRERPPQPGCRAVQGDWRALYTDWEAVRADVVYADPPYTADHYSRFYHVLEVLNDYDYPVLQRGGRTKGRYPVIARRHRSAFCVPSRVEAEVAALLEATAARGAAIVLSYGAENGLLLRRWREEGASPAQALERFAALARRAYGDVALREKRLLHSGQGDSNHQVTELLLVARRPRARRGRREPAA